MKTLHSYEDMGRMGQAGEPVYEAYKGTDIVQWHDNIERQLTRMLEENEASRNYIYADKIREFLRLWRENVIEGSMNVDTIKPLEAAANMLAVDPWNLGNYFSNIRSQLRKLLASEEELPRVSTEPNDKMGGPGGGAPGGAMPPLSPEFGPEKGEPGAEPPAPGGEPTPEEIGKAGGATGEPEAAPGEEGAPGEPPPGQRRKTPPPPRARM